MNNTRRHLLILLVVIAAVLAAAPGVAWAQADHPAGPSTPIVARPDFTEGPAPVTTITLQSAKGDISEVLRMVAAQGGLNLVIGPEVKGAVSVYLEDVEVNTALKAIAVNNGFDYMVEDGVITVSKPPEHNDEPETPQLVTQVFEVRCQDAERVRDALEFALTKYGRMKVLNENSDAHYGVQSLTSLSGNFSDTAGGTAVTAGTASASGGNQQGQASGRAGMPVQAGVQTPRNARRLIVTDTRENIEQIARLVADLDRLPPQVLIEARIVEMSTDLQRQLGIDWNPTILANGPIIDHKWPLNNRAGFATGAQIPRNISGDPMVRSGMALGTIDFSQFTALVQAHQTDNSIRLLANPRLLVYNNHSASILVGERYPILQATITDFGTVTEAFSEYIPVGVQLEVTPTIMKDGRISLLVHPATSALGDDVIGTTGLRVARIRTRELDTRVIMDDAQTIVLGGLISDRKTHSAEKVPGLGDVPFLDVFFRQENPQSERVDLLVFLTAHIQQSTEISDRDQAVYDMYRPHFKHVERLQDVPLHFEIPTEYEPPKPMFSDPPNADLDAAPPFEEPEPTRLPQPAECAPEPGTQPEQPVEPASTPTRVKAAQADPPPSSPPSIEASAAEPPRSVFLAAKGSPSPMALNSGASVNTSGTTSSVTDIPDAHSDDDAPDETLPPTVGNDFIESSTDEPTDGDTSEFDDEPAADAFDVDEDEADDFDAADTGAGDAFADEDGEATGDESIDAWLDEVTQEGEAVQDSDQAIDDEDAADSVSDASDHPIGVESDTSDTTVETAEIAAVQTAEKIVEVVEGLIDRAHGLRRSFGRGWVAAKRAELARQEAAVPPCRAVANVGANIHAGPSLRPVSIEDAVVAEEMTITSKAGRVATNLGERTDAAD